jgi:hypothetical protein
LRSGEQQGETVTTAKRTRLPLRLALVALVGFAAGCHQVPKGPGVVFETQPRPVLESIGLHASWDPKLAVDTSGTIYIFAVYNEDSKSRLGLVMSHDGGDTLAPSIVPISEAGVSIGSHGEQSPSIAMARGDIYALWQQAAKDGSETIMSGRSLSWGDGFEKPVQVSDKGAGSYRGFPSIGVAPNGDVYAVWLDERDNTDSNADSSSVYLAKSVDRGATFGQNVRVGKQACPCCRPSLAFGAQGEVFVAWRRVFPGEIRDLVVSASRDGGRTFAESVRVHDDGWKLRGCPDCGATLAESNGTLYIAWMTEGKDERPRIEFARSNDGARSFSQPVDISRTILDPDHPNIKIADDGTLWLAFQGRAPTTNGNWSQTQAYIVQVNSRGTPSPPLPVPGSKNSVAYPAIGLGSGGRIYLAWTQPQGNHPVVMLSRGRTTL